MNIMLLREEEMVSLRIILKILKQRLKKRSRR
jgi:hypothetical protein